MAHLPPTLGYMNGPSFPGNAVLTAIASHSLFGMLQHLMICYLIMFLPQGLCLPCIITCLLHPWRQ
jgi:hypothetical protein